ncbi:phosphohistidine phosphatase SixA [Geitlerinema sp. PCC 9228]|jgi:phosphohistidine phosphatase|uniref:phosphohistidine phosphatase SixA n=1 Tax=Geitlerinema sp. PCC 9228 TaxID=111611 RepID=UPI0008F9BF75|nr:phosphohistidine phosphatase SixA [Geitlerinema sp. PCC 9228]
MQVYFIRHGIAVERQPGIDENERWLTDKGIKRTQKVAKRLAESDCQFDCILTSPLVRAKQTAEILQEAKLGKPMLEFAPLAPGGNISAWIQWLSEEEGKDVQSIALVGHEPDLGHWAEQIIWGQVQDKLVLKKAGVIGVSVENRVSPLGQGTMFLLVPPKFLL